MNKENNLRGLLVKAEGITLVSIEKELVVKEISNSTISDIGECLDDNSISKFKKELSDIYVSRLRFAVNSLRKKKIEELLRRYHKREGNKMILSIAITRKLEDIDNRLLLIKLANQYNLPGIQERIIKRIYSMNH